MDVIKFGRDLKHLMKRHGIEEIYPESTSASIEYSAEYDAIYIRDFHIEHRIDINNADFTNSTQKGGVIILTTKTDVNKPVLTKAQAKALDLARIKNSTVSEIYVPFNDVPLETLVDALVNGYQVEKSTEEKVREFYESFVHHDDGEYCEGVAYGINQTLDLLGIDIPGVNAPDEETLKDSMF